MKTLSIKPLNSFQIIVLGFAGVILAGALLLMLPVSSATHCVTPFLNALFTSTTSVCVTGLIVVDTGTYWSVFGQAVILVLIQIGGMGVVTVAAAVTIISGRKIGLMQRSTMQEAVAAPKMSGIVRLTGFIIRATLLIELSGAALLAPVFCRDFGPIRGLWMARVPFHFRLLQRRDRPDGDPYSLFFSHTLCRKPTGQPGHNGTYHHRRNRLSDLGRYPQ